MTIQSIHRAISILSLFSYESPRLGIMDMANALNLGKGTIHNIVKTLCEEGLLKQEPETRKYILGTKLFSLGSMVAGTLDINQKAMSPASRLAQKTGLGCRVGIWDNDAVLVTLSLEQEGLTFSANRIGPRLNAYGSAIGRALLAYLPKNALKAYLKKIQFVKYTAKTISNKKQLLEELEKTRARGYALNDEELIPGRATIAAPIFQSGGKLVASISLTGSPKKILGEIHEKLVNQLHETASEINRKMGLL